LDNLTEHGVMEAVHSLIKKKQFHHDCSRLSTVRQCIRSVVIEAGRVLADGNYDELLAKATRFRAMGHNVTSHAAMGLLEQCINAASPPEQQVSRAVNCPP